MQFPSVLVYHIHIHINGYFVLCDVLPRCRLTGLHESTLFIVDTSNWFLSIHLLFSTVRRSSLSIKIFQESRILDWTRFMSISIISHHLRWNKRMKIVLVHIYSPEWFYHTHNRKKNRRKTNYWIFSIRNWE